MKLSSKQRGALKEAVQWSFYKQTKLSSESYGAKSRIAEIHTQKRISGNDLLVIKHQEAILKRVDEETTALVKNKEILEEILGEWYDGYSCQWHKHGVCHTSLGQ